MDRDQILNAIRRTAEENGGVALGQTKFEDATGLEVLPLTEATEPDSTSSQVILGR